MSIEVTARLKGYEGLRDLLRELPDEVTIKALGPAVNGMGRFTLGKAKEKAGRFIKGYSTGATQRNIKLIAKRSDVPWQRVVGLRVKTARQQTVRRGNKGREAGVLEGFLAGEKKAVAKGADDPYYWFFVEFGTAKMQAQPFLRPALEEYVQAHINHFRTSFAGSLLRTVSRLHGKQRGKMLREAFKGRL